MGEDVALVDALKGKEMGKILETKVKNTIKKSNMTRKSV
jgi:hypothetical protein